MTTVGGFNLPPSPPESGGDSDAGSVRSSRRATRLAMGSLMSKSGNDRPPQRTRRVDNMKRLAEEPKDKRVAKKAKADDNQSSSSAESAKDSKKPAKRTPPAKRNQKKAKTPPSPDSSEEDSDDEVYEVEHIVDYWLQDGEESFLIKWKGWVEDHNSWEERANLSCDDLLLEFFFKRVNEIGTAKEVNKDKPRQLSRILKNLPCPPDPRPLQARLEEYFEKSEGGIPTEKELLDVLKKILKKKRAEWPKEKIDQYLLDSLLGNLKAPSENALKEYALPLLTDLKHQEVIRSLKVWEQKLNSIAKGKPKISVENVVDFTGPPNDFTYVNEYVAGKDVFIPDDPPYGCECEGSCLKNKKACCARLNEGIFAYNSQKRVIVEPGTPIYECNRFCPCDETCVNRVVQDGHSGLKNSHFCIFRTEKKGWGVKTMKTIKKGEFVAIYAGEVIRSAEAERRGNVYDRNGQTYLFDLDINETEDNECPFVVDAKKMGNVSHFFNHSCDPNLIVYNVFANCLLVDLPLLALFSTREIAAGEELTFQYNKGGDKNDGNGRANYQCYCEAKNCRGTVFV